MLKFDDVQFNECLCVLFCHFQVKKTLRGVKVEFTNGQTIRSYKIAGVSKEPLSELM